MVKKIKNENYDEIILVLDRSGSMAKMLYESINGLNKFITEQKKLNKKAYLTVIIFDDYYEVLIDHTNLKKIPNDFFNKRNYRPRGWTALLDAIGRSIQQMEEVIDKSEHKPENVIMAILTDGKENSSKEYKLVDISSKIKDKTSNDKWKVIYLAANQDAISEATSYSIPLVYTTQYYDTRDLVLKGYGTMSNNITNIRTNQQ